MYGDPSAAVPKSYTAVIPGWFRTPAARASASKRFKRSGSVEKLAGSTLTATSRPKRGSFAR